MKIVKCIAFVLILAITACTTSKNITSWKKENAPVKKYNKILLLGFMREADNSIRENMEGQFAEDLQNAGINAVSSLELYGSKVFNRMDEDDALYQLNNSCVDAVLTITLLDKEKENKYYPGNTYYTPYGYSYDRFWRYRTAINYRISQDNYYEPGGSFFCEYNLYDMTTQKLIYSVHTKSFGTFNYERTEHEYGRMIVKDMIKKNILTKL